MKNHNSGQSIIELLVGMGIFVISLAASFQLFFGGQSLSVDSVNERAATDYGEEAVSALHSIRNRNFSELTDGSHGLVFQNNEWMFSSSSTSDSRGSFTRTVTVANGVNDNVKTATTTITWNIDPLRTQKVEIVEQLTNWEKPSESSCKTEPLSGDWTHPQTIGTADLGAGNQGTDVLVRYPYVFMSGTASTASKPDIFVFDVSNPAAPVLVASKDIGAGGINSIFIQGNYLYAASPNDSKELVIFDISTPAAITEVGSFNLSGSADALSVVAFGNTVAIGREDDASKQLAFINVSNPASPVLIREISMGVKVLDFAATSNLLYVVGEENSDAKDVWTYDISDTANPVASSTYSNPLTTKNLSVYLHYKGGTTNLLLGDLDNNLVMLGATTTSGMYVRSSVNVGGGVNDVVCAVGDLAFLATTNSTKEFIIVDVHNPDKITEYASLNYPQVGTGIDYYNNKVYMSVRSNDSLRIISSQ